MKRQKKIISLFLAALMTISVLVVVPMTASAATATEGWGPEADGIYYIDDANDMLAFSAQASANGGYNGKTVKLRADIDMKDVAWTQIADFYGTLDGNGFAIKNLAMSGTTQVAMFTILRGCTIKDIKFIDCTATGTSVCAVIGTLPTGVVTFDNVYVSGTVTATGGVAGGFLAKAMGASRTVNFKNCISDVAINSSANNGGFFGHLAANSSTLNFENCVSNAVFNTNGSSGSNGGFIGVMNADVSSNNINISNCVSNASFTVAGNSTGGFMGNARGNTNNIVMTDCVFTGDLTTGTNVVSGTVGHLSANLKLERVVAIGDSSAAGYTYRGSLLFLDKGNDTTLPTNKVELIDCYATLAGGTGKVFNASSTTTRGVNFDVSIIYDGQKVYEHKDSEITETLTKENGTYSKLADINAAFKTLDGATFTAEKFAELCPALATSGNWAVTTETVSYGTDKTITKIIPASVAAMVDAPIATAPNAANYLQIKNTTDGNYDVRFIGAVNAEDLATYAKVGFAVVVKVQGGATVMNTTIDTAQVYTSINADGVDVSAETLGADYLNVLQIKGFKADNVYEVSVLAFAEKADGTVVYDYNGALNVTVQNGALVD